jgi:hypothetical protein
VPSRSIEPQQGWWHAAKHKKANQGIALQQLGHRDSHRRPAGALKALSLTGGIRRPSHQAAKRPLAQARWRSRKSLEPVLVDSIDLRMQSFVEWRCEVPLNAKRLEDFDARKHAATWIRHNIGKGVV